MKKVLVLALVTLKLGLGGEAVQAQSKGHLIIAILDFRNTGTDEKLNHLTVNIPELLTTFLARSQKLYLVERLALSPAIRERELHRTENFESTDTLKPNKLLGANAVLIGSFFNDKKAIVINARLVCVESGTIRLAEQVRIDSHEQILASLEKMAASIESKILQDTRCNDKDK